MSHVLLVVQNNSFPSDKRVVKEAFSLMNAGYSVSVISPVFGDDILHKEEWNGICVRRYRHYESPGGISGFILEYSNALLRIFFISLFLWFHKPFISIHVANPPDFFWPMAIFYKLLKVKFIYDQHDISAEMYRINENAGKNIIYKFLNWNEHITVRCADGIITTNTSIRDRLDVLYGLGNKPCNVVYNGPAAEFVPKVNAHLHKQFFNNRVILYIGEMASVDCVEVIINAAEEIVVNRGHTECKFILLGDGPDRVRLEKITKHKNLSNYIEFTGMVSHDIVMNYLSVAEICLVPDKPNGLNEYLTLIKCLEYMKSAKAFVAFDLKETRFIAGEGALFASNFSEYIQHILFLLDNKNLARQIGEKGQRRVEDSFLWEHQEPQLLQIYYLLLG